MTLRRTHSAHSRAIARWVSLLRSRISNSEPYRLDSPLWPCGMKNSRRSLRSLSVTLSVTNDGEVKMNSSSLDLLQLLAERLEREDRERRRRDANLRARRDLALEIVAEQR